MSDKKIIAVVGATGTQGGGLARALLDDSRGAFAARALTRKPSSDPAKALAAAGAEVVEADLDDPKSLARAFAGCHGAFGVTNFWEHFSPDKEMEQARNMASAAKEAGLEHVIWSTLEDTRKQVPLEDDRMPTLGGRWKVPHFDAKGASDAFFSEAGVPTTYLLTVFYWENLIYFGMAPKRGQDGVLTLTFPLGDAKMPSISAPDIGPCAYALFKAGQETIGKRVGIAGDHVSGAEMASSLAKAFGEEVRYQDVPPEVYRSFGFPGADDLGNMFQYKRDFERSYRASRPLDATRRLHPGILDFEGWVARNAERIPRG